MKFRGTIAAAALAIGALTVGSTVAHAEEAPAPQDVSYSVKLVDKTIVATLKNGTFELTEVAVEGGEPEDKQTMVNVKDTQGATLISFPLAFDVAGSEVEVKSELKNEDSVLEVVPEAPADFQPGTQPLTVQPIASPMEDQRAMNSFSSQFGMATAIGGFVGTAIGAIIGCIVTIPAMCVPGLVAGAGIGGILGTIAVGGPTLIAAGLELIQTLQAAPGTTKWAN
ncbi:Uncharacterised protein [Nocardia otitidiscaviarum]|uniref:DUF8020 domain-containing protein n=1 Tax=Nocardia otitidiscaviarum TaxID=1823 RepID=A0A378YAL6_9NOCA|nr:hypothetical protein [Nocardia otitidiscaviarum]SUA74114.1 Uncharacterised protein [Nocardia otitidiscaviarum]